MLTERTTALWAVYGYFYDMIHIETVVEFNKDQLAQKDTWDRQPLGWS